jgi:hypothetical protein
MALKSLYLKLEDDVNKIVSKLKKEKSEELVLVFPKKSFLFSDSINLRLLKKQIDLLNKKAYILTMDDVGQMYAREAGFELKFLPKSTGSRGFSDIRSRTKVAPTPAPVSEEAVPGQRASQQVMRRVVHRPVPKTHHTTPATQVSSAAAPTQRLMKPPVSRPRFQHKALMGFVALALIIIIVLVLVVLPQANITVYAKSQSVARDIDLNADVKTQKADAASLAIPALAVDETREARNTFQTQGKREVGNTAQGRVVIYNLTGAPLNLKATTTVLSVGSKNYTFNEDQNNIKQLSGPNDDVGASVADITAQAGGESFNLPAGTRMEITNQVFGSQPQRLYAKTATQVVGGSSRFLSVISKEDIDVAQKSLQDSVLENVRKDLQSRNMVLLESAFVSTPSEFTTDKAEGTETPTFVAATKVRLTGLAINQDELAQMLRDRLKLSLSANKTLQDVGQDAITFKVRNLDTGNGVLALSIHYESKALPNIDQPEVRQQISGKSKEEASEILLSNPDIERVDIALSPSWQTSIPRLSSKIDLKIEK